MAKVPTKKCARVVGFLNTERVTWGPLEQQLRNGILEQCIIFEY